MKIIREKYLSSYSKRNFRYAVGIDYEEFFEVIRS